MTEEELQSVMLRYKRRFRCLRGWKVTIRFGTHKELLSKEDGATPLYGMVYPDPSTLTAQILVRREEDYGKSKEYGAMPFFPVETTVMHELLHCVLDHVDHETGINMVADAMVGKLKRKVGNAR